MERKSYVTFFLWVFINDFKKSLFIGIPAGNIYILGENIKGMWK